VANHRSRNKPPNDTSPEITTTSTSLGRETLVAIAEDEADQARALLERKRRSSPPPRSIPTSTPRSAPAPTPPSSAPRHSPRTIPAPVAPQATIPAITPARVPVNALTPPTSVTFDPNGRSQMVTMDYQDPPPNRGRRESSEPTIETGLQPMGRETLAAITTDLAQELLKALSSEERANWLLQLEDAMVLEPFRFEVRGAPMLARPNDTIRREFVAVKLLHRLPVRTIDQVERIDVAPTADDGLTLTIWVKIPEPGGLPGPPAPLPGPPRHHEDDPPVLLPSLLGVVAGDGALAPEAGDLQPPSVDAVAYQPAPHRLGSLH
jgi:hypothetical protein